MPELPVGDPTYPDLIREIADLKKSVRGLERNHSSEQAIPRATDTVIFSHADQPEVAKNSPPYVYHRPNGYLTAVVVAVGTSGGLTNVKVMRRREGTTIELASVYLEAGDHVTVDDDLEAEITEFDHLFAQVSSLGSGIADVTVTLTLMEGLD